MILTISLALAQATGEDPDTNGQLYQPTIDGRRTLWTNDAGKAPDGYFLGRGLVHYANRPVVYRTPEGDLNQIVSDIMQLSLLGAYTKGPVRFGVDLPVYLRTQGDASGGQTGLGDLALDVKGTLLDPAQKALGLAVSGRVNIPTATVQGTVGNRGVGMELQGIVDKRIGKVLLAANVGTRFIPKAELENFTWNDQFIGRGAIGYGDPDRAGASLDVGTHVNYANIVPGSTPAEAIVGGWGRVSQNFMVRGGLGTGITSGFGAPRFRAILGLTYEPPFERDSDGDGLLDSVDSCPDQAEDMDGYKDGDGCAEPTPVTVRLESVEGGSLDGSWTAKGPSAGTGGSGDKLDFEAGAYTFDATVEGFEPASMSVDVSNGGPQEVVVKLEPVVVPTLLAVRIVDEDGAVIEGAVYTVGDKEFSGSNPVQIAPGDTLVRASAPGYKPLKQRTRATEGETAAMTMILAKAKAEIVGDKIDIRESVYFETAKAKIKAESFALLDEVAQILQDHPELTKIRVEGHTDSRGSASYNLRLSTQRAASVRDYLIAAGIAEARVVSEGFGESKPLVQGNNEAAWSKNRRVDFFVMERSD